MNVVEHNRRAWDHEASSGGQWSQPVSPEVITEARRGNWSVLLTPKTPAPRSWFPDLKGIRLLALASGGGQQVPVFAAAGAKVTSFDNSQVQLDLDRQVADREGLDIRYEQGDMADLSHFEDASFDFIFHPVSNCFVEDVRPAWKECYRVLAPGGTLIAGFFNPVAFMPDYADALEGKIRIRHAIPYSDLTSISEEERLALVEKDRGSGQLVFGHSLTDQIGGQTDAGFHIIGFKEDYWTDEAIPLNKFTPTFIQTRALKPEKI